MKFIGTVGENNTAHFYEAQVMAYGERAELEIQANSADEARATAKAAGHELLPLSLKFVC